VYQYKFVDTRMNAETVPAKFMRPRPYAKRLARSALVERAKDTKFRTIHSAPLFRVAAKIEPKAEEFKTRVSEAYIGFCADNGIPAPSALTTKMLAHEQKHQAQSQAGSPLESGGAPVRSQGC
jgi:hypothetical protein